MCAAEARPGAASTVVRRRGQTLATGRRAEPGARTAFVRSGVSSLPTCGIPTTGSPYADEVPDVRQSVDFRAVVAQTSAVLLMRGVEVEPVAVRDVVALMVRSVVERMNMGPEEALHLVRPESVAEAITPLRTPAAKARSTCTRCGRYGSTPAPLRCRCRWRAAW